MCSRFGTLNCKDNPYGRVILIPYRKTLGTATYILKIQVSLCIVILIGRFGCISLLVVYLLYTFKVLVSYLYILLIS